MTDQEAAALGAEALAEVQSGHVVGLGTGQAATAFILALGRAVKSGLRVTGVPTSEASATLARQLGIPLIDEPLALDVAVDGADEVDPRLDLVKGYGGALVREKIVAAAARRFVVVIDEGKLRDPLGGRLPVELVHFGHLATLARLDRLGGGFRLRLDAAGRPVETDNGNLIADGELPVIDDPVGLGERIDAIPGVVGHGLFCDLAGLVLVARRDGSVQRLAAD